MMGSVSFWHVKKTGWLFAAAAAFILTVADCMCRNRDTDVFDNPLFGQFVIISAVSFASFACIFLFSRFFFALPLLAAGGVCVFLFAADVRALYVFVALPAILLVLLLRYCPWAEKCSPVPAAAYGVLSVLELAAVVCLLHACIVNNTPFFSYILPFFKWNGRISDNYYGLVLLLFLFVLYVVFELRRTRNAAVHPEKKQKKNRKKKGPDGAAKKNRVVSVWLRFAAVCLFFLSAALYCLECYTDLFFPVPSFVNLVAVFVLCGTGSVSRPEAILNSKSAEVVL